MKLKRSLLSCVAFAAMIAAAGPSPATKTRASEWGFNAEDSTDFLQAAITSGVRRLIIDRMPSPWVTRPLHGASDIEIVFEPGVVVEAKKGSFLDRMDCFLAFENCTNVSLVCRSGDAILRMHHDDYFKPPYMKGEWRHVLSFLSCANVRIEGLTLLKSGGDGIYIGQSRGGRIGRDFTIRNVVSDSNARQGLSVITVENLLVERCTFVRTKGALPQAGIDFEPNAPEQVLSNILVRDCVMEDNAGEGIVVSLMRLRRKSKPVSIRIQNCLMRGNAFNFNIMENAPRGDAPTGEVALDGCRMENSRWNGANFSQKVAGSVNVLLKDCTISGSCSESPEMYDVRFASRKRSDPPPDDIRFENLKIVQPAVREPFGFYYAGWCDEPITNITGTVTVENPSGMRNVTIDAAWREALSPIRPAWRHHVPARFDALSVVDAAPGKLLPLPPLMLRGHADYGFYASSGRRVNFKGESKVFRTTKTEDPWITVCSVDGKWTAKVPFPENGGGAFCVDVPAPGFYRLSACPSRVTQRAAWGFRMTASHVPVAILLDGTSDQGVYMSVGEVFLNVMKGDNFEFHVSGEGQDERIGVVMTSPDGKETLSAPEVLSDIHQRGSKTGVWTVRFARATKGMFEDYRFDLTGIPALVFLRRDRMW